MNDQNHMYEQPAEAPTADGFSLDDDTPLCPLRKPGDDSDICESCQ